MMIDLKQYIDPEITKTAVNLKDIGLNELAWSKTSAIAVIESVSTQNVVILGGDVYRRMSNDIASTYDNWSCTRLEGELQDAYAKRSCKKALDFITNYDTTNNEEIMFVLVFDTPFFI